MHHLNPVDGILTPGYQDAELVVLAGKAGKTFIRFNDLLTARLFVMQVGELHAFFYGVDFEMRIVD